MSRIKGFLQGINYLVRGFGFLLKTPKLWLWAIFPTIINLAILGLMITVFIHYYSDIYAWLSSHIGRFTLENPNTWYLHVLSSLLFVANFLFQALLILVSLILLLITSYALSFIIAGPFNDALSERVEILLTGTKTPPFTFVKFFGDLIRTIKIESIKAIILISLPILLFVFNFLPAIGGPLYVILTFIFGAWDLGFSYSDLPYGRRAAPFSERFKFARKNFWSLVGLGIGFVIPFFSLIFTAPLVVGGTILFIDKKQQ